MSKPYNPLTLAAQVDAFRRIRDLYAMVATQATELRYHQGRLLREQEVAERIFAGVMRRSMRTASNIQQMLAPAAIFGDIARVEIEVATTFAVS